MAWISQAHVVVGEPGGVEVKIPVFRSVPCQADVEGGLRSGSADIILEEELVGLVGKQTVLHRTGTRRIVGVAVAREITCESGAQRRGNLIGHTEFDTLVLAVNARESEVTESVEALIPEAVALHRIVHVGEVSRNRATEAAVVPRIASVD